MKTNKSIAKLFKSSKARASDICQVRRTSCTMGDLGFFCSFRSRTYHSLATLLGHIIRLHGRTDEMIMTARRHNHQTAPANTATDVLPVNTPSFDRDIEGDTDVNEDFVHRQSPASVCFDVIISTMHMLTHPNLFTALPFSCLSPLKVLPEDIQQCVAYACSMH